MQVLLRDRSLFEEDVFKTVLNCFLLQPEKVAVYATLVGLINAREFDYGGLFIEHISERLLTALRTIDFATVKNLVLALAELVNANVLLPEALIELFDKLLLETQNEEAISQLRNDAHVNVVLTVLPWIARDLADRLPSDLHRLLALITRYMARRSLTHIAQFAALNITAPAQVDALASLWQQVLALQTTGWRETIIPRLYARCGEALARSLQHNLPAISVPRHPIGSYPVFMHIKAI